MSIRKLAHHSMMVLTLGCSLNAIAQPRTDSTPISIIVPNPAGNPSDGMARKLVPSMQKALGQTLVVENLPGAGGSIGANKTLSSPAQTPSILVTSQTEVILTPLSLKSARYRPEQFRAIGFLARTSYVLAGRPDLPPTSLGELSQKGRQAGAKALAYGHVGHGSMIHLLGEQWSRRMKVPLTHVPYKGVPPVVQDLMAGQIDLAFVPLAGSTLSSIQAGRLKPYGTTSSETSPHLPKVEPLRMDRSLDGFVYGAWAAMVVPRATPEAEVSRLHRALMSALNEPDVKEYLISTGVELVSSMTLEEVDSLYKREIKLYTDLAREVGIRPE